MHTREEEAFRPDGMRSRMGRAGHVSALLLLSRARVFVVVLQPVSYFLAAAPAAAPPVVLISFLTLFLFLTCFCSPSLVPDFVNTNTKKTQWTRPE